MRKKKKKKRITPLPTQMPPEEEAKEEHKEEGDDIIGELGLHKSEPKRDLQQNLEQDLGVEMPARVQEAA